MAITASSLPGQHLQLFILAGEPSGDVLGADLLKRLNANVSLQVSGVGGEQMLAQGLDPFFPISDLSVMGFSDVIKSLPRLLRRVGQVADHILSTQPDCVVLIDYQEFSAMVAKRLRKRGFSGPVLLYVAPSVWAWRPQRARKLKPLMTEILSVLPFEPRVFEELGGPPTTYVGHPAVERIAVQGKANPGGTFLVLPGSRWGEIRRHLPYFRPVAEFAFAHGAKRVVMPTLSHLAADLKAATSNWDVPVDIVTEAEARDEAWSDAFVAVASAGTVTLELALAGVPHVLTYVPDRWQRRIYENAGRPNIGLPNIIMDKSVVPEIDVQSSGVETLKDAVAALMSSESARDEQKIAFAGLRKLMVEGEPGHKKKDAAERVLFYLNGGQA
jgi:lipid-A-disaccharide synthase